MTQASRKRLRTSDTNENDKPVRRTRRATAQLKLQLAQAALATAHNNTGVAETANPALAEAIKNVANLERVHQEAQKVVDEARLGLGSAKEEYVQAGLLVKELNIERDAIQERYLAAQVARPNQLTTMQQQLRACVSQLAGATQDLSEKKSVLAELHEDINLLEQDRDQSTLDLCHAIYIRNKCMSVETGRDTTTSAAQDQINEPKQELTDVTNDGGRLQEELIDRGYSLPVSPSAALRDCQNRVRNLGRELRDCNDGQSIASGLSTLSQLADTEARIRQLEAEIEEHNRNLASLQTLIQQQEDATTKARLEDQRKILRLERELRDCNDDQSVASDFSTLSQLADAQARIRDLEAELATMTADTLVEADEEAQEVLRQEVVELNATVERLQTKLEYVNAARTQEVGAIQVQRQLDNSTDDDELRAANERGDRAERLRAEGAAGIAALQAANDALTTQVAAQGSTSKSDRHLWQLVNNSNRDIDRLRAQNSSLTDQVKVLAGEIVALRKTQGNGNGNKNGKKTTDLEAALKACRDANEDGVFATFPRDKVQSMVES
ncbi:uncharacterized protein LY89DRAFT_429360 [Mollisia scopiformis]|uniref:Uncharacterized protein n=1 Tax=Mollisia scopiformis TaxID=149040 RepID=A0A194XN53_MOLSC|nr:uncharacterized protein LY89DRAFT_429360 [Mollisia scopiformis]KUJ21192.1 hypothetical protein LY89DRAFT_429360 [Mollisia scopiformis]